MKPKLKHLCLSLALGTAALAFVAANAAPGTASDIDVIDNLGATVKAIIAGNGKLVIDGIILAAAAYGTAVTKSPAPIIGGIISCGIFHLALKLLIEP